MQKSGDLITYGDDYAEEFRQAAGYRILKGAKASRSASPESEEVRAGHQSQDRQGARPDHPRIFPGARRRGDRVTVLFAAVHESGSGTKRRLGNVGFCAACEG